MKWRDFLLGLRTTGAWASLARFARALPTEQPPQQFDGIVIAGSWDALTEYSATFSRCHDKFLGCDIYEIIGTSEDGASMSAVVEAARLDRMMQERGITVPLLDISGS